MSSEEQTVSGISLQYPMQSQLKCLDIKTLRGIRLIATYWQLLDSGCQPILASMTREIFNRTLQDCPVEESSLMGSGTSLAGSQSSSSEIGTKSPYCTIANAACRFVCRLALELTVQVRSPNSTQKARHSLTTIVPCCLHVPRPWNKTSTRSGSQVEKEKKDVRCLNISRNVLYLKPSCGLSLLYCLDVRGLLVPLACLCQVMKHIRTAEDITMTLQRALWKKEH